MTLFFKPVNEKAPDLIQAIKDDIAQYEQLLMWCQAEKLPYDFEWGEILMGASRGLCSWYNDLARCDGCPLRYDDTTGMKAIWCLSPWHRVEHVFWNYENDNGNIDWNILIQHLPEIIGKLQEVINDLIAKGEMK